MVLHIFFLPFHHSGHLIPMVDLAKLFAVRDGVKATIVTTPTTALRIKPSLESFPHPVDLLSLPCPENSTSLSSSQLTPELEDYLNSMESPFETLVADRSPDCIVSDLFYPWSAHVASRRAIPRLAFHVCSCFSLAVSSAIFRWGPLEIAALGDEETFLVPGLPHAVPLSKSLLPAGGAVSDERMARFGESLDRTYGTIANTFREMDRGYNERLFGNRTWLVGPVSPCEGAGRGGEYCDVDQSRLASWLDGRKAGSVIYVCFGSLGDFAAPQLREIASGLVASNCPFVWVVRNSDGLPPATAPTPERGLIITGWAPQTVILDHPAVGGFVTHCGWNSIMEGAKAGVPMVTWPLYAEQFLNEKLVVDVLRIGVPVGSKVRTEEEEEEERVLVSGGKVKEVVEEVMGGGAEAEERRKRAEVLAEMAKMALEEGGSSYNDLSSLIQELEEIKATNKSCNI